MSRNKKEEPTNARKGIQLRVGKEHGRKPFVSHWAAVSPSSELTRSESFWLVQSNVQQSTMLKYLRLKIFWQDLNPLQEEFAFSHPKILQDLEFNVLLSLLATTELSRVEILKRMIKALTLVEKRSNFHKFLLPQWDNHISIVADLESRTIRSHEAFTGWVRNASSVGSKKKSLNIPEPLSEEMPERVIDEFNFLYELISVGRIETNLGVISLS